MPIKRFYPTKDTTITNANRISENSDAKKSNMGQSDSLEIFRVANSASTDGYEESRILLKFDASEVSSSAASLDFPLADTKFYLRLFNVKHDKTTPSSFEVQIASMTDDFDEGHGLDMETYKDLGAANWLSSSQDNLWVHPTETIVDEDGNTIPEPLPGGGDFTLLSNPDGSSITGYFEEGTEDLLINITSHVSGSWCGAPTGLGSIMLKLPSSYTEHYTKKFFSRGTNFHFKKPCVEARWESVVQDNGGNLFKKSSRMSETDNTQSLYFYNWVGDELKNIPDDHDLYFRAYSTEAELNADTNNTVNTTATKPATGIYKVSIPSSAVDGNTYLWYKWYRNTSIYLTGNIELRDREFSNDYRTPDYNITINNLKDKYSHGELANLRLSIRKRDHNLNVYTISQPSFENDIIESMYYKITRRADAFEAISYGDGKDGTPKYTKLSYDTAGNYFDLDISLLEKGFMYEINFIYKIKNQHVEYKNAFKFRVE